MSRLYKIILGVILFITPAISFAEFPPQYYGVSVSGRINDTVITLSGFSSPNALITILEDSAVVATFSANLAGDFSRTLTARVSGPHTYGLFAQDTDGRTTSTYSFILNLTPSVETIVNDIFLPTTIEVTVGQKVNIFGKGTPNSQVTIFVHSTPFIETTSTDSDGNWNKQISTPIGLSLIHI